MIHDISTFILHIYWYNSARENGNTDKLELYEGQKNRYFWEVSDHVQPNSEQWDRAFP